MKISVILVVFAICSTTLAQSSDGRKPKRKLKKEPVRGGRHYEFPGIFPGSFGERHSEIRKKPRIPYVDEKTSANNVTGSTEYHGHRYKEMQKGRHVEGDEQGRHSGADQQGRHSGADQQGRHSGADQQGRHSGADQQDRHSGADQQGHHVWVDHQGRHVGVDHQGRHVGVDHHGRHVGNQEGRHVDQQGRHVSDQQGRHGEVDRQSRHGGVDQRSRQVGVDQKGRHVGVKQDTKQRGRQTRQSHNTFLTVQVPPVGSLLGGTQGSNVFQSDILSQFPGGLHAGIRPGNQGGFGIPGGVVTLGPGGPAGGTHGGSGGFASIGLNGNFPFNPINPTGGSPGTSSAGGPGGLNSGSESGLAGGLGGAYGAGYGFGLGGLIFGGPNGPVFAGNAALGEGFSGSPDGALANDEFEEPDKQNAVQKPRILAFRPMPSRWNSFEADKANSQANRGVIGTYPKAQHPNGNGRTLSPTSNGGETVGYVAFIFPKRNFQRQNPKAFEFSSHPGTVKTTTDAAVSKPKTEAASATTRPAPTFLPVPVHIPIDRPYPVLVPKPYPVEVLKPYPVAVPIREPVPYEIARPIPVPVAVPAEVARPAQSPYLTGINSAGSFVLQPSLETSILHKRSDKIDAAKPA